MVLQFDDGVLINHSYKPNIAMNIATGDKEVTFNTSAQNAQEVEDALLNDRFALMAIKNINVGDELTMDYTQCIDDPSFYDDLYERYDVSESFLE
jgi:hypothetical protein